MKGMKTKSFLSLALALAMSLSLAGPVFAAEPEDSPSAGTKPLPVYPQGSISMSSGYSIGPFTTSPGAGAYLQVWFANRSVADVTVILMNGTNSVPLKSMTVAWNSSHNDDAFVYHIPNADVPNTFYIRFESRNSARVLGDVAATLYAYDPSDPSAAGPEDPDEKFTPKSVTLYENKTIKELMKSNYTTNRFTSTPGEGQYIKVWFRNYSKQTATVKLYRTDSTMPVLTFTVGADGGTDYRFYEVSDAAAVTYYVNIDIALNYPISGYLAVAQKNVEN